MVKPMNGRLARRLYRTSILVIPVMLISLPSSVAWTSLAATSAKINSKFFSANTLRMEPWTTNISQNQSWKLT